jgi:hypothetical protein
MCYICKKKGAKSIANRETQIMKRAIKTHEEYSLKDELQHYYDELITSHKTIINISSSSSTKKTNSDTIMNSQSSSSVTSITESLPPSQLTPSSSKKGYKKSVTKYQPLLAFILPPPDHDRRDKYSPIQAILVVLNNANKST